MRVQDGWIGSFNLLDELFGLDVGHAVHTGNTITIVVRSASQFWFAIPIPSSYSASTQPWHRYPCRRVPCVLLPAAKPPLCVLLMENVPDRQDAASLGKA